MCWILVCLTEVSRFFSLSCHRICFLRWLYSSDLSSFCLSLVLHVLGYYIHSLCLEMVHIFRWVRSTLLPFPWILKLVGEHLPMLLACWARALLVGVIHAIWYFILRICMCHHLRLLGKNNPGRDYSKFWAGRRPSDPCLEKFRL